MKKGKHEAANAGGWQRGGDPFAEEMPEKGAKQVKPQGKKAAGGGWKSWGAGKKGGVIALSCLAALVLLAAGWWAMFVKAPDVKDNDRPGVSDNNPNRRPGEENQADVDLDGDGEPDVVSGRKEDYFTFLLLG